MIRFLLSVVLATCAFAQVGAPGVLNPFEPSLALRQYLELTNEQVATIVRLNTDYLRFQSDKMNRQSQVSLELSQEMRRDTLDPMAIGVRYVEMEAIRRELAAEQKKVAQEVQALLTAAQRTKIQALQEVLRTYPIACEALSQNLMSAPEQTASGQPGVITGSISAILLPQPMCGGVGGIRTGDFSFIQGVVGMPGSGNGMMSEAQPK